MMNIFRFTASAALLALVSLGVGSHCQAALFFWDDGGAGQNFGTAGNWAPDGIPGVADLAVHNNGLPAIEITNNQSVDSLRLSDGGAVVQSGGILDVTTGFGPDDGLWIGEFGPAGTSYTLNGGTLNANDVANGFDVGRGGGANGVFNQNGGTVNINGVGGDNFFVGRFGNATGEVNITAGIFNGPSTDTHIGLDGTATWNQSGGVFNAAGVHVGRFQSPTATVNLSGTATWNTGLLLLSDAFLGTAVQSDLNLTGPNVTADTQGLVMKAISNLTFDGTGGGVSTLDLNSGIFLLDNGELFLNNLPVPSFAGETITLIDNIGTFNGPDSEFDNAPDGTTFGPWEIDYTGTQVNLVSLIPEPTSLALVGLCTGLAIFATRRR